MSPELDKALCNDFPLLYAERDADMRQTAMCWGFPDDKWEPIIRQLSEKLVVLIGLLPANERGAYRASQVKEKFGTLRFYMSASTDEMDAAIQVAEESTP